MSKEISRRDFLKMAGFAAASVLFSSCAPKEKPVYPMILKGSDPTPKPTIAPTTEPEKVYPTVAPTPRPTEAPKPTPTETLRQKWGKVWEIGGGIGTGGQESGLTNIEERFGSFIEQITKQLEARGESLKQTELFVGAFPKPEVDARGKPKLRTGELDESNSVLCAYIFGKAGKKEVYCATEGEKGEEAQIGAISTVFTPDEKIWGSDCQERVDGSLVVFCKDGTTYKTGKTVFGGELTKLTSISDGKTMTGYLFTAVNFYQKELMPSTFFLAIDEKKLPYLPEGKSRFDMEKFIPAFDLASARLDVWENNLEKDYPHVGNWDLEAGKWTEEGSFKYDDLFKKLEIGAEPLGFPSLKTTWNEKERRYDYLDVDNKVIAYWDGKANEGKGKIEILFPKDNLGFRWLDLEKHKGLFVEWEPKKAEQAFLDAWQKEKKVKLPLPFEPTKGTMTGDFGLVNFVCFPDLPEGTLIAAPYDCVITKSSSVKMGTGEKVTNFMLLNKQSDYSLRITVSNPDQYIHSSWTAKSGEILIKTIGQRLPSLPPNNRKYELWILADKPGFSLDNFQEDDYGRLVYIKAK